MSNDIRYNPPIVVPVQVARELQEYIPLFTGYILYEATTKQNRNQVRSLYVQLLEEDQRALQTAAQSLADLTEYYMSRDGTDLRYVETVIRNTATMVNDAMVALAVQSYPQQFNQYLTQQEAADLEPYIATYQYEMEQAKAFFNGGHAPQRQNTFSRNTFARGGGAVGAPTMQVGLRGRGRAVRDFHGQSDDHNNDDFSRVVSQFQHGGRDVGGPRSGVSSRSTAGSSVFIEPGRHVGSGQSDGMTTYGRRRTVNEARQAEAAADIVVQGARPTRRRGAPLQADVQPTTPARGEPKLPVGAKVIEGQTFVRYDSEQEWPVILNPERPMDWMVTADVQFQPAFNSSWKPSMNTEAPYPLWYDPATHLLFNIKRQKDGFVLQKAMERKTYMGYLDNELDPQMRALEEKRLRERDAVALPAWAAVGRMRPVPDRPLSTTVEVDESVEGVEMSSVCNASIPVVADVAAAYDSAFFTYNRLAGERMKGQAVEFYFDRCELARVDMGDSDSFYRLAHSIELEELQSGLEALKTTEGSEKLFAAVDERLTNVLNWTLNYRMGISWKVDCFYTDIGELRDELRNSYGELVEDALIEVIPEITSMALSYCTKHEQMAGAVEVLGLKALVGEELDMGLLVWMERCSVTRVPLENLDSRLPNHQVAVTRQVEPELYATLESILNRTEDAPCIYRHRYIVTADEKWYELVRGALDRSSILVFPTSAPV